MRLPLRRSLHPRKQQKRLFWVVDRRTVIDQVIAYVDGLIGRLRDAPAGTLAAAVSGRLRSLSGSDDPVERRLWRGALDDEGLAAEATEPLQVGTVAIIGSTVDQIGSRMLFSGYGVSPRSRPLHAGLIALDSLVVLDEAHLSQPFLDTARSVAGYQAGAGGLLSPMRVVSLTATPREGQTGFALSDEELADGGIARRASARKPTRLAARRRTSPQADALAAAAVELADGAPRVVGVVANTVATARAAHERLRSAGDALLLIGPVRPLDREGLIDRIPRREARGSMQRPLFVVGTQTLEVGLDVDFDVLVTACAPLAALVQRFGRLDRAGCLGEAPAVIVAPDRDDPVYGEATAATWSWLERAPQTVDFGIDALRALLSEAGPPPHPAAPLAPLLAPWHVEALACTSFGHPWPPEVDLFLHGDRRATPELQIAWRADLELDTDASVEQAKERLRARPPHPAELLTVPLWAARRWLAGDASAGAVADLEGAAAPAEGEHHDPPRPLRVPPRGPEGELDPQLVAAADLRPGDVVAVPAGYGGCDRFGWAPAAQRPVSDLGNLAARRPAVLVAMATRAPEALRERAAELTRALALDELGVGEAYRILRDPVAAWLRAGGGFDPDSGPGRKATQVTLAAQGVVVPVGGPAARELVLISAPRRRAATDAGEPVTLAEHGAAVEDRARADAERAGLAPQAGETIAMAARHHDVGKRDPRFQAWLADGAPQPGSPLAKSGAAGRDQRRREAARQAAGWPAGKRHELLSAAAVERVDNWPDGVDPELLAHLVVAHHGYGRPFFALVDDPQPPRIELELDGRRLMLDGDAMPDWRQHAERFARLQARYGAWGLALLEAVLVLADRSVSAEEGGG